MLSKFFNQLVINYKRYTDRKSVYGIHDEDLQTVLREIGSLDEIISGSIRCTVCGKVISLDNLGGWRNIHGQQLYFCDMDSCLLGMESSL